LLAGLVLLKHSGTAAEDLPGAPLGQQLQPLADGGDLTSGPLRLCDLRRG
jgi:hypothetical protein